MPTDLPAEALERRWHALQAKLERHAPHLVRQGVLVPKRLAGGGRVWAVRFVAREGGRPVHRSLYVGSDRQVELRRRVRRLLDGFRARARWPGEVAGYARLAGQLHAALKRLLPGGPGVAVIPVGPHGRDVGGARPGR